MDGSPAGANSDVLGQALVVELLKAIRRARAAGSPGAAIAPRVAALAVATRECKRRIQNPSQETYTHPNLRDNRIGEPSGAPWVHRYPPSVNAKASSGDGSVVDPGRREDSIDFEDLTRKCRAGPHHGRPRT